jgi:rhodanese-related sulfurtransferase
MRKLLATLCLLLLPLAALGNVTDIDSAELARLQAAGVPVVDIRTPGEWKETGVVPGSHPLMFFDEKGNYDAAAFVSRLNAIAKPGDPVIVICRSGNRTREVSRFLSQKAGYTTVYNAKDGILAWVKEKRPVAPMK